MDRIVGAFTFRRDVYAEVEHDESFTPTAWLLVIIIGFLSQLGSGAATLREAPVRWLLGAVGGTVFVVIGFAVGALVINFVGRTVFKAEVSFDELIRTLGLAYIWNILGFLGILAAVSGFLQCVLAPIQIIGALAGLVAWFVAAKEALDLDWVQTIVTVFLGWLALMVVVFVGGAILGLLGLGAAAVGGLFSS
jgi:hypothetical protein